MSRCALGHSFSVPLCSLELTLDQAINLVGGLVLVFCSQLGSPSYLKHLDRPFKIRGTSLELLRYLGMVYEACPTSSDLEHRILW